MKRSSKSRQGTRWHESNSRSFYKAVSWRVFGSFATGGLVYGITGSPGGAVIVGGAEFCLKVGLYYLHERIWERIGFGRHDSVDSQTAQEEIPKSMPDCTDVRVILAS